MCSYSLLHQPRIKSLFTLNPSLAPGKWRPRKSPSPTPTEPSAALTHGRVEVLYGPWRLAEVLSVVHVTTHKRANDRCARVSESIQVNIA